MRSASSASAPGVVAVDDAPARRALWIVAAAALAAAVVAGAHLPAALALVGVAAACGAKSYADNEVRADFRAPLDESWIAAIEALADNGLVFGDPTWHGVTEGSVRAGDAKVTVELHPGTVSRVRVRVGTFALPDNRRRAALILERVAQNIKAEPIARESGR